jgi:sulfite oxidase
MILWSREPLNAETPLGLLCRSAVTPTELFFVRSHGAVPDVDPEQYRLTLTGDVRAPLTLSLAELRRLPRTSVTATLACAGNRRGELGAVAGAIPWGAGAIGNAVWTGVRLADLLGPAGVAPEARHVAFTALDTALVAGGSEHFGGSIPLDKALDDEVLIADEMNGEPLPPEHGFPLRAVVPGYIGARSVKWLAAISVQRTPSESFFQTRDYAVDGRPLGPLPLSSALCALTDATGGLTLSGYAVAGDGRSVARVEVSTDGGRSWSDATLRSGPRDPWTWRLWDAEVALAPGPGELVVRAHDDLGRTQPEHAAWNPRGYLNDSWHRTALAGG